MLVVSGFRSLFYGDWKLNLMALIGGLQKKVTALKVLKNEFTALSEAIAKDLNPYMNEYNPNVILNKRVA